MASREWSIDAVPDHALPHQQPPVHALSTMFSGLCCDEKAAEQQQQQQQGPSRVDQAKSTDQHTGNQCFKCNHLEDHLTNDSTQPLLYEWNNLPLVILCKIFFYLTPCDRLSASSTCNSWRNVIYHPLLWPQKHLQVNLCPHKFTVPYHQNEVNHGQQKSGFHTYTLREPMWFQGRAYPKRNEMYHRRPNRHNFNEHLKSFIHKCSRFLSGLTIYFDPNSSYNVIDLIKILKHMSENEVAIYAINGDRSNIYANCRNLKSLSLIPVTPLVRSAFSERFMYLYYGLTDAVRFLFAKCQLLEQVSLGDLHELVYSTEEYIAQFLKHGHERSLRHLHLSSIKGDIFRYIPHYVSFEGFEKFCALQSLSIDFDVLDTDAINVLYKLSSLQSLIVNVHRVNRYHPGISKEVWSQVARKFPALNVTVNLLHTESNQFGIVLESLLNTDLPLKVFRAYYLEFKDDQAQSLMCNLLEILALRHSKSLQSVVLAEHLERPKRYLKSDSPNPLVMFTWRCRHLSDLTIIGFELTDIDIIAIARLRGPALRNFHFPASCIQLTKSFCANALVEDGYYYSNTVYFDFASSTVQKAFNDFVSVPLHRPWQPIANYEIPENVMSDYIPQMTYHRTLIEQNCTSSIESLKF